MESQAKRKNRVTARALRSALAFVALALGLARASQAGPQTLEIDASKFPQVTLTLRLPAEKITKDLTLKDITINEEGVAAEPSRYATTDSTALPIDCAPDSATSRTCAACRSDSPAV